MNVQVTLKNDVEKKTIIVDNETPLADILTANGFSTEKSYSVQGEVTSDLTQPLLAFDDSEEFFIFSVSKIANA